MLSGGISIQKCLQNKWRLRNHSEQNAVSAPSLLTNLTAIIVLICIVTHSDLLGAAHKCLDFFSFIILWFCPPPWSITFVYSLQLEKIQVILYVKVMADVPFGILNLTWRSVYYKLMNMWITPFTWYLKPIFKLAVDVMQFINSTSKPLCLFACVPAFVSIQ